MARYIDADALDERKFPSHSVVNCYAKGWNDAIKAVQENAPTIEARPVVHGRWIDLGRNYYTVVSQCSECGAKYDFRSPYCPNCGTDMRTTEVTLSAERLC